MTDGPNGLSDAALAAIARELSRGRLRALAESVLDGWGQAVDIRASLAKLAETMPVRMILGHKDRIIDWRECLDVSGHIATHHIPCAGHMLQWEAMADVLAILKDVTERT